MRAAFFSDSHGGTGAFRIAMETVMKRGKIDLFAFLGDGIQDFLDLRPLMQSHNPLAQIHAVWGNNDPHRIGLKEEAVVSFGGIWLFLSHGHLHKVKLTDRLLLEDARDRRCRVAVFGHTHHAFCLEKEGILLFNPGSVSLPVGLGPSAGILEIGEDGVLRPQIVQLRMYP